MSPVESPLAHVEVLILELSAFCFSRLFIWSYIFSFQMIVHGTGSSCFLEKDSPG